MWRFLLSVLILVSSAHAGPPAGRTSVVVVMKMARCSVCATQLSALDAADLGVPVLGLTHDPPPAAAAVTARTGVPTYSHPGAIESMGLWLAARGIAQPAVVVFDRCGEETGRIVGRRPGTDISHEVRALVVQAEAVQRCGGEPNS